MPENLKDPTAELIVELLRENLKLTQICVDILSEQERKRKLVSSAIDSVALEYVAPESRFRKWFRR